MEPFGSKGPMDDVSMEEVSESHSAFCLLKCKGGVGWQNPSKPSVFPKTVFQRNKSSWLQECVTELANKLSLMEESKLRTNELHELLSSGVSASCRGTWRKESSVFCLCNGTVFEKGEKILLHLGTNEPLVGLVGRMEARTRRFEVHS